MERHIEGALRKAMASLDERGLRYAVVGGLALPHWGVVRATYDIDIKVLVPDGDYAAARLSLRAIFPEPAREPDPQDPLIVSSSIEGVTVDFLLALPGYEEKIIERAVPRDLGQFSVPICSAEDLIIQKVVAGRAKDWLDVESLLVARRGRLDEPYIEDWLSQFAEALEKPDLLRAYHSVAARVRAL